MNDSTPFAVAQRGESPYTQYSTYKLTRACWWALHAPDSGRHSALEAEDLPEPYRALFDAILDGTRGLARVAAAGGPALDLLDVVAKLPRPRAIPPRRLELPDTPELAAALFGRLADDLEIGGAGVGEWPGVPSHTCGAGAAVGTVLTFRPRRTQAARMFNPTWRTCPACLYQRAKRMSRQTLITRAAAGPMTYTTMTAGDYRKWAARTRQARHRGGDMVHYRAMPQEGGDVFIMATAGIEGATVPTDRGQLLDLIRAHCMTPQGHNVSSNRGYGGDFKHMRGDGRDSDGAAVQRYTDSALETVAAALDVAMKPGSDRLNVQIDHTEALERLHLAGVALRDRRHVTHLVQSAQRGKNCTKSVTTPEAAAPSGLADAPPPHQLRLLAGSTYPATGGKEAAPCAIYLP